MQTRTGRTSTRTLATRTRACTTPSRKRRDSLWKRSWSHGLCIRMRRGHQPSAHSHPSGSSRRDATSRRGGTTDALWFQTMNVYNAGVVVVDTYCGEFALEHLDGRALHGKASAQTHTKHKTLVAFLKHRLQGLQKVASSFRPLFCGHAYSAKYEQVSKNGRPFSN